MDKVSVIMPCFNDGAYIEAAIESVRKQTYPNIELIIIDDGSDDAHTKGIIESISDPNIKTLHTERVRPAAARNAGIAQAEGKYILPLDSDDMIESQYIEKAVRILESNAKIGVVYCFADLFGEKEGRWQLPDYALDKMLLDNIVFVTAMFYKSDWEMVGGFNASMHHGMEDYDFWLSILEMGREIHQIPEVLFHYRIKSCSRTTEFTSNIKVVQQTYRDLYNNHPKLFTLYKDRYAIILRDELIHQLYINAAMKKSMGIIEKINKIPLLRRIARIIFGQ